MGLLDQFFSDDPQKVAQMAMAFGLLGGAPNGRKNFGADLSNAGLLGMTAYGTSKAAQARLAEEAQQQQMRTMQMDQMRKQQGQQDVLDNAVRNNYSPGMPQMQPTDYETPSGPMGPSSFNVKGFMNALPQAGIAGVDKMLALQQAMAKDSLLGKVSPEHYTPESIAAFHRSNDYSVLVPRDKVELSGGVAYNPYNTKPGSVVLGPSGDVVGDGKGGFQYNPAKISPIEKARLGLEGQRVGMEGQKLNLDRINTNYNTGFNFQTGQYNPGIAPKEQQQALGAAAKTAAEFQQTQRQNLPDLEAQTANTIGLVDKLLDHPGFSTVVGAKGPTGVAAAAGYPIAGTDAADWVALKNQVVGQQFMQAYQTLKGAGQITEVEGKKATQAISRMDTAQSEDSFKAAAHDFQNVMRAGLERARQKAGGGGWSIRPIP
jgi:hypothetical protein